MSNSFVTPWIIACQIPLFMGILRQENWSGLPFPSPGDHPNPGIEPRSPAFQEGTLTSEPPRKPIMTTGKIIALTRRTFVGKVMSLLFNMLPKLVITFLPMRKHLLISWLQSPSAVTLEPPKIKSLTVYIFPHLFAMKWWDQMLWFLFFECWVSSQLFHSPLSPLSRGF